MDRLRAHSSAPSWWFGAPLFGVLFGFVANQYFPDFVASASMLIYRASGNDPVAAAPSPATTRVLAPLVGTVLAVAVLGCWRLTTFVRQYRSQV
ncbi:MAG TPA: hypothetical protein VFB85_18015 [Vicinamibacterales bacterium]|nr:hypothetical protein [Vicinamibacterales bacterium]